MELHRHLTRLVRFNGWANARILEQAVKILPEQPSYAERYGVLPDELLHIVHAEEYWMGVWRREKARQTSNPSRAELVAAYATAQAMLEGFLAGVDESDLVRVFTIPNDHVNAPLADLIAHLIVHNSFHRGGIALLLTNEGHSPGDLDVTDFILQDI